MKFYSPGILFILQKTFIYVKIIVKGGDDMPSGMIHLAIANEIAKYKNIENKDRFFVGSLSPDSGNKDENHYKYALKDGRKTYSLKNIRKDYSDEIKNDPLVLGYYLHVLTDVLFRDFIFSWYHTPDDEKSKKEKVGMLHRDYSRLNSYISAEYGIKTNINPSFAEKNRLFEEKGLSAEAVISDFEKNLSYPESYYEGDFEYLTPERTDEFISYAVCICLAEINSLDGIGEFVDEEARGLI